MASPRLDPDLAALDVLGLTLLGATAQGVLARGAGPLLGCFPSSVYLGGGDGTALCLLPPGAEPGVLHALLDRPWPGGMAPRLDAAAGWHTQAGILQLGPLQVNLRDARPWQPPLPRAVPTRQALARAGRRLADIARHAPEHSLLAAHHAGGLGASRDTYRADHGTDHGHEAGRGASPGAPGDWRRHALPVLQALRRWLRAGAGIDGASPPLAQLIGLGPGLTPSLDDVLGALLVGLHAAGATAAAQRLARPLPALLASTHPVSAAHLRAAAAGGGCAALHEVLQGLLDDAALPEGALQRLLGLGQHSGWDMLTGLCLCVNDGLAAAATGHAPAPGATGPLESRSDPRPGSSRP